jgi:hypothetical protein
MPFSNTRFNLCLFVAVLITASFSLDASGAVRFNLASNAVIQARLAKYAGNNQQREANLKAMFQEAGATNSICRNKR